MLMTDQQITVEEVELYILDYIIARKYKLNPTLLTLTKKCFISTPSTQGTIKILFSPTTKWIQGGPIIEHEEISVFRNHLLTDGLSYFSYIGEKPITENLTVCYGKTPLIAAMRSLVVSHFGPKINLTELY